MEPHLVDAAAIAVEGDQFGRMAVGLLAPFQHLFRADFAAEFREEVIRPGRALAADGFAEDGVGRVEVAAGEVRRLVGDVVGGEIGARSVAGHGDPPGKGGLSQAARGSRDRPPPA